jgi:multicomponent Na+:H+ antiporter subunit E
VLKIKYVLFGALLYAFWLFLTISLEVASLSAGLMVVLFVLWFNRSLLIEVHESSFFQLRGFTSFFVFVVVLLKEIVIANIQVAKIVLNPKMPIQPTFFYYPVKLKKAMNKVIFANAITLTPGTLTIDVEEDGFIIHALTDEAREGLPGSVLEKYANKLENEND